MRSAGIRNCRRTTTLPIPMPADRPAQESSAAGTRQRPSQGMLDTNILIMRRFVNPDELPDEMAISAITLAELSAGPHQVRPDREQAEYDEHAERGRRLDVLQRVEHEFDPVAFDSEAARAYGQVTAAVIGAGRSPRLRTADLMIASTAIAAGLPLYTTNPDDFAGLDELLMVVPVTCPRVHRERVRP